MRRLVNTLPLCLLGVSLGLRATPGSARAPEVPAAEARALEVDAPPPATEREREAEALVEQARELFREARFQEALPLLERAYELSRAPRYLFNLGAVHHKLSQCEPAREYYERYLAEDPRGSARSAASWALQELYAHCPGARSPANPAPASAPESVQPTRLPATSERAAQVDAAQRKSGSAAVPRDRSALPSPRALVLLGTGAALGVAALVSSGLQSRAQHDVDALRARAVQGDETWDSYEADRASRSEDAHTYRRMSILLGVGFGVLAGTGTAFWILDSSSDSSLDVSITTPGVSYRGRF
jgi:tetratricopeptide (TPR) repeat protein